MDKRKKPERYKKIIDDTIKLPEKHGNGILKYSVRIDPQGSVMRYSLVYINPRLCAVDNARVLGYDNSHGYHHRHYMGKEERVEFMSYEEIEKRFEAEWRTLHEPIKGK